METLSVPQHLLPRIAVIGLGRWGRRLARVLSNLAEVVICCSRRDEGARAWVHQHIPNARWTGQVEEVFEAPEVEAIAIATPISTHFELTQRALTGGKHVFVEKPLATSVHEAMELVRLSAERDRRLFVGHIFLYHPCFAWLVAATERDPIALVRVGWSKWGTFEEPLVWNLLVHDVALTRILARSRPMDVKVMDCFGVRTAIDVLTVKLLLDSDVACWLDINRCIPESRKVVAVLTRSGQWFVWEGINVHQWQQDGSMQNVFADAEEPLVREVRAFIQSMIDGGPVLSDGRLALEVVEIILEVDRQAQALLNASRATTRREL